MKIFITGSNGFIGRNLVEYYNTEHEVYSYTRENLLDALQYFKPTVIINSAAEIYNSSVMFQSNVEIPNICLNWIKTFSNETKMIQIGSSSEYGILPYSSREIDRINPVNMYQSTKGMATLLCQGMAREFNLDITIARPYSVYGKYEKSHRLFPKLWKACKLNVEMTLYNGYHDFIYINDFIKGIDILVKNNSSIRGDIVNFGSGMQYSNLEVLELFKKVSNNENIPVKIENRLVKEFESTVWVCNNTYATEVYKFQCDYSLLTGIQEFLETATYDKYDAS